MTVEQYMGLNKLLMECHVYGKSLLIRFISLKAVLGPTALCKKAATGDLQGCDWLSDFSK